MKEIVILNGAARAGKNCLQDFCSKYARCRSVSTVDKVKEAYALLGWNGEKSEQHRKALSDIKDIGTANLDHPYTYIKSEVEKFRASQDEIMFIHSREPEEIARFVKEFGCVTVLVKNPNVKQVISNHADAGVDEYLYDYTVINDGTLEELDFIAKTLIDYLKGGEG